MKKGHIVSLLRRSGDFSEQPIGANSPGNLSRTSISFSEQRFTFPFPANPEGLLVFPQSGLFCLQASPK
jgi:hypothetical protein